MAWLCFASQKIRGIRRYFIPETSNTSRFYLGVSPVWSIFIVLDMICQYDDVFGKGALFSRTMRTRPGANNLTAARFKILHWPWVIYPVSTSPDCLLLSKTPLPFLLSLVNSWPTPQQTWPHTSEFFQSLYKIPKKIIRKECFHSICRKAGFLGHP